MGAGGAADRAGPAAGAPLLQLQGITCRFGEVLANDDISLTVHAGQVLALLGENGAGKSTLVSVLFGHYRADAGRVLIDGVPLPPADPAAALARGIGMVHQHFALAENLLVIENIVAGTRGLASWSLRRDEAVARVSEICQRFGLSIDPWARVADLSVGERQRVEILKALYRGARLLILDEPTAVLGPRESESLFDTLAQFVDQGLAIIFISHKLDEVLRVSDVIAVLRGGRLLTCLPRLQAQRDSLAEIMVGHRLEAPSGARPAVVATGTVREPVLQLRRATVRNRHARVLLDAASLAVAPGEILGIAGVSGNGQSTLADVLCGVTALSSGEIVLDGQALPANPRAFTRAGVARIPEDRHGVGVIGDMSVWENAVLDRVREPVFCRGGWLRRAAARRHAARLVADYDVRGLENRSLSVRTRLLSGGNVQKLILGRALSPPDGATRRLILANQPTWGLDVGAVAFVHARLREAARQGAAIVLISEDLDELFAIATHIAVMHAARLSEARVHHEWTMAAIGAAMTGTVPARCV